jgi:hypothetical protein
VVDDENSLQCLFSAQRVYAPSPEKTVALINLFQGFFPIVGLPEAKDIEKEPAGGVPIETFQFRKVAGFKVRELPALW